MADDKKAKLETLAQLERMRYYLGKVNRSYTAHDMRFKNQEVADSIEKFGKLIDSLLEEKSPTKKPSPTKEHSPTKKKIASEE